MKYIIFFLLLVLLGAAIYQTRDRSDGQIEQVSQGYEDPSNNKLLVGSSAAEVSVVMYFDYKCPNCVRFSKTTEQEIINNYTMGQLNFEVVPTPIVGPDSANAARGAYCANEQNIFSAYHQNVLNYMWENYYKDNNFSVEIDNLLTPEKLAEINTNAISNMSQFTECINSDKYNPNLDENLFRAADDSIRGTPGFVIGSQSFVGTQPFSVYKNLINLQLEQ